jgi:hypothetical protein
MNRYGLTLLAALLAACGATPTAMNSTDAGPALRDGRYCEILLGTITGGNIHIKVYSTVGVSDCPQDTWSMLDTSALKSSTSSDLVLLNGPRYWLIDSAAESTLLDPTIAMFGGIPMRQAGAIDVALAQAPTLMKSYVQHTITRDSVFTFAAGKSVFELVDLAGPVYTMQSYSTQKVPQSEATLPVLGASLQLPTGLTFRTRTLATDLVVRAVNHQAIVVQDDNDNTYLESQ